MAATLPITEAATLRLKRLTLRNFKGVRSFELSPKGGDMAIYGENATGKTTIADAILWLLFGKDSQNSADFEIKTLDADGNALTGLEHSVFAEFDIAGDSLTLERIYKEVWTKKRGNAEREFDGHTTDYKVNGVPVQKKEYDSYLAGICDEKLFRLLSDPTFFSTHLKWQERRAMLLTICGDITEAAVIEGTPQLAALPALLGRHTIDEFRKIKQASRKETNSELESIPVRLDELSRSLNAEVQSAPDLDAFRAELQQLTEKRAGIAAGGGIAEKRVEISKIEAEILDVRSRLRSSAMAATSDVRDAFTAAAKLVTEKESEIRSIEARLADQVQRVEQLAARLATMKAEYWEINARAFEWTGVDTCASCGQSLPSDKVAEARAKAEANFNELKAKSLETNKAAGRQVKAEHDKETEDVELLKTRLEAAKSALPELKERAGELQSQMGTVAEPDYSQDPQIIDLNKALGILEMEIEQLQGSNAFALAEIDGQLAKLRERIADGETLKARADERERGKVRHEELKARSKELAKELEAIDHALHLCDEFVRAKVRMLEERINDRFKIASFKLFETQVNGAIAETCEITAGGVPYGSLNHAMRLNVGIDVINVLAEHHGFAPLVIIDGAESITRIEPTTGQQIRLVVSEADMTLRPVALDELEP
jgi:DNA repair exonuclease SbcCD ATPase subunit